MDFIIKGLRVYQVINTDRCTGELLYGDIATPDQIADPNSIIEVVSVNGSNVNIYRGTNGEG